MERVFNSGGAASLARCASMPRLLNSWIRLSVNTFAAAFPTRISSSVRAAPPVPGWAIGTASGFRSLSAFASSKSFTNTRSGRGKPAGARTVGVTVAVVVAQPATNSRKSKPGSVNNTDPTLDSDSHSNRPSVRGHNAAEILVGTFHLTSFCNLLPCLPTRAMSPYRTVDFITSEIWSRRLVGPKRGDLRRGFFITKLP